VHEIDGSYGEGGGQLVRTSVALAAITGQCVHLFNIRAKRNNPGLAPQHFTGVKAVAALCSGTVEGLEAKTREIIFRPGVLRGGEFDFHVGTAGSITLVLQAALPVAATCHEPVLMNITGGTDVPAAPPLDYFRYILLPLLLQTGVKAKMEVLCRGYYPRGGGGVVVEVDPSPVFKPLVLDKSRGLPGIRGFAHISNLPAHILDRMIASALGELTQFPAPAIARAELGRDKAIGSGGAILLAADMGNTTLGASAVAQRGVPAERLGSVAGQHLREEILSGATLDIHASDQVLIYFALAAMDRRTSSFLAKGLSSHAATTIWLLEQFLPVRFDISAQESLVRIKVEFKDS
jgi:RNA 3'-terminal phosphate cyclase (ATP)